MGNFEGTPGNWHIEKRMDTLLEIRSGVNNKIVAECENYQRNKQTMSIYECEANAKLIAAAPELLEALIEVVRISDRNNIAWNRAKEVIKKATE